MPYCDNCDQRVSEINAHHHAGSFAVPEGTFCPDCCHGEWLCEECECPVPCACSIAAEAADRAVDLAREEEVGL